MSVSGALSGVACPALSAQFRAYNRVCKLTVFPGDVHLELAGKLKFARIWGTGVYDGQNAQHNHILNDKDIIGLHFW